MLVFEHIVQCPQCSGPVFKYSNLSDNTFIVKCGYTENIIKEEKTVNCTIRSWVENKKQPCDYKEIYQP